MHQLKVINYDADPIEYYRSMCESPSRHVFNPILVIIGEILDTYTFSN